MFEFKLPDVGEGVSEGEVLEWHVQPGDKVNEDQIIAEIETDKAVVDLPSPVAGIVEALHAEAGDIVPVGEVIITIDPTDAEDSNVEGEVVEEKIETAATSDDESPRSGRVFAPPSVRRLARERDIDITEIEGSGPGGRITKADVQSMTEAGGSDGVKASPKTVSGAADGGNGGTEPKSAIRRIDKDESAGPAAHRDRTLAAPSTRQLASELEVDLDSVPTDKNRDGEAFVESNDVTKYAESQKAAQAADESAMVETEGSDKAATWDESVTGGKESREPYKGIRRTIGTQLSKSASTIPHVTHHDTAVVPELVAVREAMKPKAEDRDVNVTYIPFVLKAVVAGLREYPALNVSLDEENDEIIYKHYYNIGIATATDAGLMVPVVDAVDQKNIFELAAKVTELTEHARNRSIPLEAMQGGTFTITNFGAIGGEYATPLINYPEAAILGLGSIEQRPVVENGEVVAEYTLPLSLSIDHRVIDGAEAASFVNTVIEYLETPSLLLLEG